MRIGSSNSLDEPPFYYHCAHSSKKLTPFCVVGPTFVIAPAPKISCRILTGLSAIDCGDGCARSIPRPEYVHCYAPGSPIVSDAYVESGRKTAASNFRCCSSRSSTISSVGYLILTSPSPQIRWIEFEKLLGEFQAMSIVYDCETNFHCTSYF